ncbi:hypothetical protein K470DRAFT_259122 [Piedraia hortae CBS 480.64]|uniref:t-SNARE coiled-coil homology domain-containing protein n=1 Tax=Piedraia hortae CBS 480.64 TaxID=1314780 RepID=A0A6A7BV57_9PEZI|nr:hypothetical protein K470DRAFT_259122 [Piedraia hortae CBS 480.64]
MPFGFKKGDKEKEKDDLDSKKASLFGRSKEKKAASTNPYATPANNDPYAPGKDVHTAGKDPHSPPTAALASTSLSSPPPAYSEVGDRNALFGDAAQRAQNGAAVSTGEMAGGYGASRELSEEEIAEAEADDAKQQIRETKNATLESIQRSRANASRTAELGRETLARLGRQGEMIHNTERLIDETSVHAERSKHKAEELRRLQRSMFLPTGNYNAVSASKKKRAEHDYQELTRHQEEKRIADQTRKLAQDSAMRQDQVSRNIGGMANQAPKQRNLTQRSKYQFEADSEDDEIENQIEDGLDDLANNVRIIKAVGQAMGEELDNQNKHLARINERADKVDDTIHMNNTRLQQISKRA